MSKPSRPSAIRHSALAACLAIALASCSGGEIVSESASAMMGPGGGQLQLPRAGVTLTIPPGALGAGMMISISEVDGSEIDPTMPVGATTGLRIEPEGLALAVPATVEVARRAVITEGSAPQTGLAFEVIFFEDVNGGFLGGSVAVEPGGTITQGFEQTQLSSLLLGQMGTFTLSGPRVLAPDVPARVQVTFQVGREIQILESQGLRWGKTAESGFQSTLPAVTPTPLAFASGSAVFADGAVLANPMQTSFTNDFQVTCPRGVTSGETEVSLQLNLIEAIRTTVLPIGTRIEQWRDPSNGIFFDCTVRYRATCEEPGGGGGGPGGVAVTPGLIDLSGTITAIEAMSRIPAGAPCKSANGQDILIAGGDAGTGFPKAVTVDPVSGTLFDTFTFSGGGGVANAFDAHVLMPPTGSSGIDAVIKATGFGSSAFTVGAGCLKSPFSALGFGFQQDTSYLNSDPTLGTVSATDTGIRRSFLSATLAGLDSEDIPVNGGIRTVVGSGPTEFLVVTNSLDLVRVSWNGTIASTTPIMGAGLGTNPRRMRWDPTSGLLAISDFTDNTVHLFRWDGAQVVTPIGVAMVGDGPVGLDVLGERVVCAGFNDGSFTVITANLTSGMIETVVTTPNPFPAASSPGHVLFLGDLANSVIMSFFGSSQVGIVSNAY